MAQLGKRNTMEIVMDVCTVAVLFGCYKENVTSSSRRMYRAGARPDHIGFRLVREIE